jgi:hypothetical protein
MKNSKLQIELCVKLCKHSEKWVQINTDTTEKVHSSEFEHIVNLGKSWDDEYWFDIMACYSSYYCYKEKMRKKYITLLKGHWNSGLIRLKEKELQQSKTK